MLTSRTLLGSLLGAGMAAALVACGGGGSSTPGDGLATNPGTATGYVQTTLVTDTGTAGNPYQASNSDGRLVNAWGIAFNPEGFVWVANNRTSSSTLYDGNGVPQSLVVSIPPGAAGSAGPTGIVYNGGAGFQVAKGGVSDRSLFIFAGEGGTLSGWSPAVDATNAVTTYDGAAAGAIYKGLALASQGGADFLYAADFHNAAVDVFDAAFRKTSAAGGFRDDSLPAGYAPFGIQAIGDRVYVAYAKRQAQGDDEEAGEGLGLVDVFDTAGTLVKRLIPAGGKLDAPWGMAMAPADFGAFANALLVANFGDGKINAYDAGSGAFLGTLSKADGSPIVVDGLWGIAFGNGINDQPTRTLFFAAGPADETHGVYGRIDSR